MLAAGSPNSSSPQLNYGDSIFDIRHRFTFTTTYDLPSRKGFAQMLEGWRINSIVTSNRASLEPDTAAGDPVLGSGGSRAMQLGLKLI
jgi:hypothetical protein